VAEIVRLPDADAVAGEAAERWVQIAQAAVNERGTFSIALAGGDTPRPLYELMASQPWRDQAPWAGTHIFWGDERRVPASDPESNYHMAREALLDHVPVPAEQIHRMEGGGLSGRAAREYEDKLWRYFKFERGEWPRFDLALLGMGADGHTASIFPGTRAIGDRSSMVLVYDVPRLGVERITLTPPVFNNARHILFLVTGEEKAAALEAVLNGPRQPSTYPAQAIQPVDGSLVWLVDEAAASQLGG
jgi:6-phosphogluconolactonase